MPPLLAIPFPVIDPVAIAIGPLAIRWYALAYIAGLVLGWLYARRLAVATGLMHRQHLEDLLLWVTVGVVLGGRFGYVLFYQPLYFLRNPLEAFAIWQGGMSFHGGMLGVVLAVALFAWRRQMNPLSVGDVVACATPIGLFFGRIANFVNAELYGRVTDVPWGVIFPTGGPEPRHPSQFYQAGLEGLALFVLLGLLAFRTRLPDRPGALVGVFLIGYGIARSIGEVFRQPDAHLGFVIGPLTMGQLLSLPMILVGLVVLALALQGRTGRPGHVGTR